MGVEAMEGSPVTFSAESSTVDLPACGVCGRQDETLRVVGFPYVISIVLVTYRRGFSGIWCRKHRNLRLILASLITATIGWMGFPFGFIYTPLTLFKLARGGHQPRELNAEILRALAEQKLRQGDGGGAVRCLEASLQYSYYRSGVWKRLYEVREQFGLQPGAIGWRDSVMILVIMMVGAAVIGTFTGVLDYIITYVLFKPLVEMGTSIYNVFLSWLPLVALSFVSGLFLAQFIEWALGAIRCRRLAIATGAGVVAALIAAYGILQGSSLSSYVDGCLSGGFGSTYETFIFGLWVLLKGGIMWLEMYMGLTSASEIIYAVRLLVIVGYLIAISVESAVRTTRWQQRLVDESQVALRSTDETTG